PRKFSFDDILKPSLSGSAPLVAVLAGVQDPGNVGTILRTAAAFGATAAITSASGQSGTASPFSPKALRASAGAALHLSILAGPALPILLAQLHSSKIRTLATSSHADEAALAPWDVDWREPVALLIGNEGAGLPGEIERSASSRVRIPMSSGIESLNAAAAAAVLFYEAARQLISLPIAQLFCTPCFLTRAFSPYTIFHVSLPHGPRRRSSLREPAPRRTHAPAHA